MGFGVGGHAHVGLQRGGGMSRGLHEVVAIGCSGVGGGSRQPTGGKDFSSKKAVVVTRFPGGGQSARQLQQAHGDRRR